jgi:hypothetical protein
MWTMKWGAFTQSGQESTTGNSWDAKTAIAHLGGTLTVHAQAGAESASVEVRICGTNPVAADVSQYLATQVWDWKRNIDGGLVLFRQKRNAAIVYLSQGGRSYTAEQLIYETVCRWNGGSYHVWDGDSAKWVRNDDILCDSATGNMGWNMTDPENKDKTEAELHKRDCGSYSKAPAASAHWKYSGVCYADAILG